MGGTQGRLLCVLIALGVLLALPGASQAGRGFQTGLSDGLFADPDPTTRNLWQDRARAAHADVVRLNIGWRSITSGTPSAPRDPADPAYDFADLDAAVEATAARGMQPLVTI